MIAWKQIGPWETVRPWLPVITVEGDFVWFRKCQHRVLMHYLAPHVFPSFISQFRSLPVSPIWKNGGFRP